MAGKFGSDRVDGLAAKWPWFAGLGLVLVVLGGIAFANLFAATVVSVYYIGFLMLLAGIMHFVHALQVRGWENVLFWGLSGLFYTLSGVLALENPDLTAAVLTLVLSAALLVAGLFRLWVGYRLRPLSGAAWIIVSGLVTALAGLVIAVGWPFNSLWILGLFLAADLLLQGASLLAVGLALRR